MNIKYRSLFNIWLGILVMFYAAWAFGAGNGGAVTATDEVITNYHLQKDQPSVTFLLTNNAAEPYLWIMARGCDNCKKEHAIEIAPWGLMRIEVNGVEIGPDRSVLQGEDFRMPGHPRSWRKALKKYDNSPEMRGWLFKYDEDFIANNYDATKVPEWIGYVTLGLNHWYVFNVKGIASNGVNKIKLIEQVMPGRWKTSRYEGFIVGEIEFGSLDEMKQRVAAYEKQQIKIDPEKVTYEARVRELYGSSLAMPKGLPQKFAVKDNFIHRDGKPFFMAYANHFGHAIDSTLKMYNYYGLINVSQINRPKEIFDLPIWLKEGWDKYHPQPWEIGEFLHDTRLNYDQGILTLLYCWEPLAFECPHTYLVDNYPEVVAQFADGTRVRGGAGSAENLLIPNQASPLFQEYLRQSHMVLGREVKEHPGVLGLSPWEEMGWRCPQGPGKLVPQGPGDLKRYQDWLEKKYGAIGKLNEEWGVDYKRFDDVKFPEYKEQTANFVNFQLWRSQVTVKCAQIQYEAFKDAVPNQLVVGQKTYGDIGANYWWQKAIDNWALTEWTDVSREYGATVAMAHLGRASCRQYGKTMEATINVDRECDFYPEDRGAVEWHFLEDTKGKAVYPHLFRMVFNGNKSFHWEVYDILRSGGPHFFHYNKRWKEKGCKMWHGGIVKYDSAGTADVVVEERTLKSARAQQMIMRNASLFLPASVPQADVAVLVTTASRLMGSDPEAKLAGTKKLIPIWMDNAGQDFYVLGSLFDNMHLIFDCVEERNIDEIFKYKVLIVGYQANVMSRKTAENIKEYVKKGGTVLFYPEAGTWNSINFQKDKSSEEISPGFGLSELCGAKINNDKIIVQKGIVVKRDIGGYKAGETVMTNQYYGVELEPKGGEVIAVTQDGRPALVRGADGKAWYFAGYLGLTYYQSYDAHERFVRLIEGILNSAGVEKRVELAGMTDRRKMVPGILEGEGYWLVGVNNFDGRGQEVKIKVKGIAGKKYEVVDISGEGFTFEKSADGNNHLEPDHEGAKVKYVTEKISGEELAKSGFDSNVPGYMSKVWLIRPAGEEVWVNATKEALRSYVELKKPLKIVIGSRSSGREKKCVEELKKTLEDKGLKIEVVKDEAIKRKVMEGTLSDDGYELEKYSHEVIDDDANLIVIGSAAENSVARHLETPGKYVFSKVPEIVDEKYPGRGRGVIQLVESINHYSYDATDKGRDAILASGSDWEGTVKAVKELRRIIELAMPQQPRSTRMEP